MNGQSTGKIIINNPDNYPVLTEYPAKTQEQEIAEAEGMKSILIEQANEYMNSAYFHERRSLNNFHRDRVITFEQIAE
ncbi:tail fiber assembly protein [Escherichia coli]|nr:tail fiber assembly protein [Escherichia coli]STH32554.1 tail assembly chaperone gp38 [Escherichia coli]